MDITKCDRIMLRIFRYLDLVTLTRCRLLTKDLTNLIDTQLQVHDLVVYNDFDFDNRYVSIGFRSIASICLWLEHTAKINRSLLFADGNSLMNWSSTRAASSEL